MEVNLEQKAPLVSVIIPVYNAGKFLWQCVNSIRNQTFSDWEGILVDDGSTDKGVGICDKVVHDEPRFRAIHKENGGVSTARNVGIEAARGKYLMFLDADDALMPTYMEKMVEVMETQGVDLVVGGYERFRADWTQQYLFTRYSLVLMKELPQFLMTYTESRVNMFGVSIWAKLYRTDVIRDNGIRFDPEITYEEDCDFNVRYLDCIKTVGAIGEVLYRYRQSDTSLSKAYRKDTFRFLVKGLQSRCALMEKNGLGEFRPKLEAIFLLVIKATCLKILNAELPKKEELQEYRMVMSFEESQAASRYEKAPKSGLTRLIAFAVRHKKPRMLYFVMHLWKFADRILDVKNSLAYKIKHGK
ncbi:MAG: glycosyltransferase [Clostridia bacterium]|nr:glycosyltransferase [Clostridia bacterium]